MLTQEEITHKRNEIFPILHYLHENGEFENVIKDLRKEFKEMANKKKTTKQVVKPADTHPCPPGTTWNGVKCVDDFPIVSP